MMVALGDRWGMENLHYKLIIRDIKSNMKVGSFCVGSYNFPWLGLHVRDRGEDDTNYVS
jgi:hypothetical protein